MALTTRFGPMLSGKCTDINKLVYPILASPKLDGIRATVQPVSTDLTEVRLLSRKLKPIPNMNVQEIFKGLPIGLDGELIVGPPTALNVFRRSQSVFMRRKSIGHIDAAYYLFDIFSPDGFQTRLKKVEAIVNELAGKFPVVLVPHMLVENAKQLLALEEGILEQGFEGVMIRSLNGPYKQDSIENRSTENEGYLLKLKRFLDSECVILGSQELMRNKNSAVIDARGATDRSTHKENMVPAGMLGSWNVRDVKTGIEFDLGGGFEMPDRERFWRERDTMVGKVVKYKYFASGSKEKPRFPIWLGERHKDDM